MRIYDFSYSTNNNVTVLKDLIYYPPIYQALIFLFMILIVISAINSIYTGILTYSIGLAAPLITVILIKMTESYSNRKYERQLKSALINEVIINIHSIKANEDIINREFEKFLPDSIATDPMVNMVWDIWDIIKFHYASKKPDFDIKIVYNYVRGLYVINEIIKERQLYTTIDFSSRLEYNKLLLEISQKLIPDIENTFKTLNAKLFIFKDDVSIDKVCDTLNKEEIPCPIEFKEMLKEPLSELYVIINLN